MAKERLEKKGRPLMRKWLARVIGANVLALSLFAPSTHSLNESNEVPLFNTGPIYENPSVPPEIPRQTAGTYRDTGLDSQACYQFEVCGTDLGIPFLLPPDENGANHVGYLFGDTFKVAGPFLDVPPGTDHYRPQVMLRSDMIPMPGRPLIFDSAAGIDGPGQAPELLHSGHLLTNDGISLPNGDIVLSYQALIDDLEVPTWQSSRSGLAVSHDGNTFELQGPIWENDADNTDPFQMWSMQLAGDYVYIVSVRSGRRPGPMMLLRVHHDQMLSGAAYEYWDGIRWGAKSASKPILTGSFGEPSLRKLPDGTWALAYTDYARGAKIVTRTVQEQGKGPEGTWSEPKVQLSWQQLPSVYGGFIHPLSTRDNLILMVSSWQREDDGSENGKLIRYDVSHYNSSL